MTSGPPSCSGRLAPNSRSRRSTSGQNSGKGRIFIIGSIRQRKARFAKLDTEAYQQAGGRYGIRGIPLMIAFRGGREVKRQSGAIPAARIVEWANDLVGA